MVLKIPLLLSVSGIGLFLNQPPFAYAKKSSEGLTNVSRLVNNASGALISNTTCFLQLKNTANIKTKTKPILVPFIIKNI